MTPVTLEDTLRRLKRDRDHADRRYNEALTELDRSIREPGPIPDPDLPLDEQKLATLNESWNILPSTPETSGVKGRLAGFIWRTIGPYLQRQLTFNSLVVEHVNRDADARRAAHRRDRETVAAIRAEMHKITAFQGRLMVLLQHVTPYVDTKDREAVSGMHVLNTAISTVMESQDKYRESLTARERRYEAWTHSIASAQEDLRGLFTASQQAIVGFNAALSSLADAQGKFHETLETRERRHEASTHAVALAHQELRDLFTTNELAILAVNTALSSVAEAQGKFRETIQARERRYHTLTSDIANSQGALENSIHAVNIALSSLADAYGKYTESLEAREHRYESRTAAIASAHEDLRTMLSVNQQAVSAIKRAVEGHPVRRPAGARVPATGGAPAPGDAGAPVQGSVAAFGSTLDAYKYVGFEDQFRGSREVILKRLETYIPHFVSGAGQASTRGDVLDVGCGRGEFLDLLAAQGISARGIDINHEMVEGCRARGLNVTETDAVTYLAALPDASLSGIFAAQVVEHLDPGYLLRFLELAFDKLERGGHLILETINPACWTAFFESYIRDITHRCALHPETLKYLTVASGFTRADIEFRSPVPPQDRLQPVALSESADAVVRNLTEAFNGNVEKLNARMFTHMDYAVIAEKG